MTLRLAASPDAIDAAAKLRRSIRVGRAADILDCDPSQVRRLIRQRRLETHTLGKRGVRIYVDSLDAYRAAGAGPAPAAVARPRTKLPAEHNEAVAYLRSIGLA